MICFGLVGLELASVMGDEIRDPQKTLPGAVAWGGVISGVLYIGSDAHAADGGRQERHQRAAGDRAGGQPYVRRRVGVGWIITPFAVMLSLSIAGIGSAWMGGSARIPFVAGLDSYMPSWLGKVHPKYATPHAALIVQAVDFAGVDRDQRSTLRAACRRRFRPCCRWRSCLQLVPFLYVFAALAEVCVRGESRTADATAGER